MLQEGFVIFNIRTLHKSRNNYQSAWYSLLLTSKIKKGIATLTLNFDSTNLKSSRIIILIG